MKRISLLGSTGSIGLQTLQVAREFPEKIDITALATGSNVEDLIRQALEFRPRAVAIADASALRRAKDSLRSEGIEVYGGPAGIEEMVREVEVDTLVAAISGFAGLRPTLAAAEAGIDIALANKESLVCAGQILLDLVHDFGGSIVPVDSEHSALFQCLLGEERVPDRLILTASGGPFLGRDPESLARVTPREALAHPRWNMGQKISIDSATMVNKGLEVIEAHWLFDVDYDHIDVIVHPQSAIHSLVQFVDGAVKAHMGPTDMRYAIMYGLSYPERWEDPGFASFDLSKQTFTFERPDPALFPCLELARNAGRRGGLLPTVLVSADEIAVESFLQGRIRFDQIATVIDRTLRTAEEAGMTGAYPEEADAIFEADAWARENARSSVRRLL